jgi:hypothetical protein
MKTMSGKPFSELYLKQGPPKYEAGVPPTRTQSSVKESPGKSGVSLLSVVFETADMYLQ